MKPDQIQGANGIGIYLLTSLTGKMYLSDRLVGRKLGLAGHPFSAQTSLWFAVNYQR